MSIEVNDILVVLKKDSEWWYGAAYINGQLGSKLGFFPGNYVEEITEEEATELSPALAASSMAVAAAPPKPVVNNATTAPVKSGAIAFKLPTRITQASSQIGALTLDYALETIDKDKTMPVWNQPFFWDLYADEYRKTIDNVQTQAAIPALYRYRHAFHVVRSALAKVSIDDETLDGMREILVHVLGKTFQFILMILLSFTPFCRDLWFVLDLFMNAKR